MSEAMDYKNYTGSIEFDAELNLYYGQILHISPLVSYEAKTKELLELAFHEAVDSYLKVDK